MRKGERIKNVNNSTFAAEGWANKAMSDAQSGNVFLKGLKFLQSDECDLDFVRINQFCYTDIYRKLSPW